MSAPYELLKEDLDGTDAPASVRPSRRQPAAYRRYALGAGLLLATLALFAFYPSSRTPSSSLQGLLGPDAPPALTAGNGDGVGVPPQCPSNLPPPATPPAPTNPWASLSVNESVAVHAWLSAPARGLNLTRADDPALALSDNVLYHIEAWRPRKADALAYLADPAGEAAPRRFARVTIHHAAREEPVIKDYLVGPLPVDEKTEMRELKEVYHRPDIPYNARGYIAWGELSPLLLKIMVPLAPITEDLFGGVALGLPNDTLVGAMAGPFSFDGSFRRGWIAWRRNVPGPWVHPVSFFQYADVSGTDPSQWKVLKIVYNHQAFNSTASFASAYHDGTLRRLPTRPDQDPHKTDYAWSTRRRPQGAAVRDLDDRPGPRSVSFAGVRFRLDRETQWVSWMGWGMYLGFDRDMGLSLWDVRFRGERIIYELAPQEAMAQYAGNDPMQATTAWLDRYFGMGTAVRDLLPGYDCPDEAAYLPATNFAGVGYVRRERAICIFEQDSARPISRHTGYSDGEFGAVKGYVLTVRSISTVGNYDYLFDYMFQLDGTIEVRVSASGYLQGGFWEAKQEGYGTAIRETTMGSLHDHVINFKVDLDVAGTANSLLRTYTAQEEVTHSWLEDDWGQQVIQQKIHREFVENEDEAKLKYPTNFQGNYALVNREESNAWGSPRGYSVHPGYSPIHNTVVGSKRLLNNANWARYNLAVTVRKETEPSSSSMWNLNLPGAPVVDFHKFFDGENMTQTDLVAWVNVGTHHLPQAEDSPNTRTNTAASSFFLTPLNYFDADVSMDSTNAILLSRPGTPGSPFAHDDYGVRPAHCVPPRVPAFAYEGMRAYDLAGKQAAAASTEELRKEAELFHRIKVEL